MLKTMRYFATNEMFYVNLKCTDTETGRSASVQLSYAQWEQFKRWHAGDGCIQDTITGLTDEEREIILTGMDNEAWDDLYAEEDYDYEDEDEPAF